MSTEAAAPVSPFKGLAAFEDSELDALFFFGRERERAVLVANLLAARLTVLYGESGVGKSSLLGAGVMRDLRALEPGAVVAMHDTWSGSVADVLAMPALFLGTVEQIVADMRERRERYGFSYYVLTDERMHELAPIVARLAGT